MNSARQPDQRDHSQRLSHQTAQLLRLHRALPKPLAVHHASPQQEPGRHPRRRGQDYCQRQSLFLAERASGRPRLAHLGRRDLRDRQGFYLQVHRHDQQIRPEIPGQCPQTAIQADRFGRLPTCQHHRRDLQLIPTLYQASFTALPTMNSSAVFVHYLPFYAYLPNTLAIISFMYTASSVFSRITDSLLGLKVLQGLEEKVPLLEEHALHLFALFGSQ